MIQSHYISMDHPYPIIRYGLEVAMQVGTLVVVEESESENGGYAIETHSHPVVSYINRERGKILTPRESLPESVVWNKVEEKDVEYLFLENEEMLRWRTFSHIVQDSVWRSIIFDGEPQYSYASRLTNVLRHLGIPVEPLVPGTYDIDLTCDDSDPDVKCLEGETKKLTERGGYQTEGFMNIGGIFTFWAEDGDLKSMYDAIVMQIHAYTWYDSYNSIYFHFSSSDGKYTELAEALNRAFDKHD